ncbi:MAG: DEAD/DEAH box helicase [Halobacteriovoraceae bacterium]|nr:DEAD/DEAH box helicase [Halobacteriovoraceae bacterium]MCB9095450.1 DEAD/DEAH box helicase [Halobacteriovoraceae bacterium]
MTFKFDQLSKPLFQAVSELGYRDPTEIQLKAIPLLLNETTDFVGQAQTGTGKTAAFCLPLLEKIDLNNEGIQAIILSPTRELANQINLEIIKYARYLPLKTTTVYGGVGYKEQLDGLRQAHVVIATPGRALDLLSRNKLKIHNCQFCIIDEADEMLKMGFIEDVEQIMGSVSEDAETWMFSATMPKPIVKLMEEKLNSPKIVRVKNETLSSQNISQSFCKLQRKDFEKALKAILLTEENFFGIVFCETKEETKRLSERLLGLGKRVVSLHGDLNQNQRDTAMELFKSRKVDILVCTDVAARGLDVSQVTHVINMGLPRKPDSYVHRIGRTGRAGQSGKAISFISPGESRNLSVIEKMTNQKLAKFEIPCPMESKRKRVSSELDKMSQLKKAIIEKGEEFTIDNSFSEFSDYLTDLSREDIVKLLFSYLFNKELRTIDESLGNLEKSIISTAPSQKYNRERGSRSKFRRKPRRSQNSYR